MIWCRFESADGTPRRTVSGNRNLAEQPEPTSILIVLPWKRSTIRASSGVSPVEASKK